MTLRIRSLPAVVFTLFLPALALAQPPAPPSMPSPAAPRDVAPLFSAAPPGSSEPTLPGGLHLPRTDISGSVGWFNHKAGTGDCCHWYNESVWASVEAGYYWTEHLKTEAGVALTSEGELWTSRQVTIGRTTFWESGQDFVRTQRLFVSQLYQFGHNAWVHPFVGAGLQVVREERRGMRIRYATGVVPPQPQEVAIPESTETRARAAALAGLKIYLSRRGFLRTDTWLGFGDDLQELVIRVGFGVDF